VDEGEESRRVVPVVAALRAAHPDVPISIDTTKPGVAAAALEAGASLVNDVWGVSDDSLARLAAEFRVPIVLMHNRAEPSYDDLMAEIVADLERAIERALRAGCHRDDLIVDPGFGFGKTAEHNLILLKNLSKISDLPILAGLSRKSTLGKLTGRPVDERLAGSLAMALLALQSGATILRVHDVRETRDVIAVWQGFEKTLRN
jgi:dihydropteroate synthase